MKDFYRLKINEIYKLLDSNIHGLSANETQQRLQKHGLNKLKENKDKSNLVLFLEEFKNTMVIILIIASLFSAIVSYIQKESYIDSIIIIIIVIINAILSFIQEKKADVAVKELNKMFITKTYVIRDNKKELIDVVNIVPGDIIELEAGDYISADCRIITSDALEVNESTLTGESRSIYKEPSDISKDLEIYERTNMLYAGCNILNGHAFVIACNTGMNTELGKIADSLANKKIDLTPLQKKINNLSKYLTYVVLFIIAVMMIIGLIMKNDFFDVLMLSISLAVAAIPEGLSSVITIILSLGMTSMAKKNVIIRKMASVETLGSTDIICSDKTGTITQNKMIVKYLFNGEDIPNLNLNSELVKCSSIATNVVKSKNKYYGDETEIAIYKYLEANNILFEDYKRIKEYPFDSNRKMMSVKVKINKQEITYTKGSIDSILPKCSYYLDGQNVKKITSYFKEKILNEEKIQSSKSLRLLAFAYSDTPEENMIFIGLIGMMDPPRENVKEAINKCLINGIKPIMITGDSLNTAIAIAKDVGIITNSEEATTGKYIDTLENGSLRKAINKFKVYARVSPNTKLKIVSALQKEGHIVAMTGDGVNDAPAIQKADIGIGMGITGTEVVKKVADCILVDDSFSTIVDGVDEGRRITSNIKKVILYLLAGNLVEVILVFFSLLLNMEMFTTIQLLWINLITDSLPAITLAFEDNDDELSDNNEYLNTSFLTPFLISKLIIGAIFKSMVMLILFVFFSKRLGYSAASSLMFIYLIGHELLFAFSCKNPKKNILTKHFFDNSHLNRGILVLLIVQFIILFTNLSKYFIVSLPFKDILIAITSCTIMFVLGEFAKPIYVKYFKDYRKEGQNEK
jgi:P-type Ca2+ transporter type 2C